jgi:hypothetical protein
MMWIAGNGSASTREVRSVAVSSAARPELCAEGERLRQRVLRYLEFVPMNHTFGTFNLREVLLAAGVQGGNA